LIKTDGFALLAGLLDLGDVLLRSDISKHSWTLGTRACDCSHGDEGISEQEEVPVTLVDTGDGSNR
jgi:hypothetical protein